MHLLRHTATLLAALSLLALVACEPPPKENLKEQMADNFGNPKEDAKPDAPVTISPDSRLSDDQQRQILARINQQDLTLGEYERRLNALAPFARARYNTQARKRDFLDNMIQFEILAQEAQRRGLDKDPEVVLEMKQAMVRRMMADELSRSAEDEIPEEELRAWYDAHKDDYVRPAKVRASQIVQPDEASLRKVLKELDKAFKEDPRHKRRIFALKAKEISTDKTTAKLGGDMRFFAHPNDGGTVSKEVADVAFGLKDVGQLSEPFQSEAGWHVLMLTARKQRYERSFEDVKRSISNRLRRERRSLSEQKFVDDIKAKAKIEIKDELLNTIPDPELPEGQGIKPHHHEDHEGNTTEVIQGKDEGGEEEALPELEGEEQEAPAQGEGEENKP